MLKHCGKSSFLAKLYIKTVLYDWWHILVVFSAIMFTHGNFRCTRMTLVKCVRNFFRCDNERYQFQSHQQSMYAGLMMLAADVADLSRFVIEAISHHMWGKRLPIHYVWWRGIYGFYSNKIGMKTREISSVFSHYNSALFPNITSQ